MDLTVANNRSFLARLTSWEWRQLGDICRTTSGGTPSRKNPGYFRGNIPWVKSGELPDGPISSIGERISEEALRESSAKLFPEGTLLIALYGATVGKLGILTQSAATNQAVCAIFPPSSINTKFLFWFLKSRRDHLISQAVGGAQPNISQAVVRGLDIPVPPMDEQHEIVSEIEMQFSRLDETVAKLTRASASLVRYKAAVLKSAAEGRLVPTEAELARRDGKDFETASRLIERVLEDRSRQLKERGKYKQAENTDLAALPKLVHGWTWATLEVITDPGALVLYGILQPGPNIENGVPYVRPTEIVDDFIDLKSIRRTSPEIAGRYKRSVLRPDDIILSIVGTIGKVALVPDSLLGGNITQSSVRIRPVSNAIDPNYLAWMLRSPILTRQYDRRRLGTAVPRLNVQDVRLLAIPVAPLNEQRRVSTELKRLFSIIQFVETEIRVANARVDRVRQGLLARLFRTNRWPSPTA